MCVLCLYEIGFIGIANKALFLDIPLISRHSFCNRIRGNDKVLSNTSYVKSPQIVSFVQKRYRCMDDHKTRYVRLKPLFFQTHISSIF